MTTDNFIDDPAKSERIVRGFVLMAVALISCIFGFLIGVKLADSHPLENMTPIVQNVHNFIRRDIFMANEMTPSWDVVRAVDTQSDTLIVRFSSIDSVRYYLDDDKRLWREDVILLKNVWKWRARLLPDSTSYEIFIALGDSVKPISYEWVIIPRVQTP